MRDACHLLIVALFFLVWPPRLSVSAEESGRTHGAAEHWAFVGPTRPSIPDKVTPLWRENPIDALIEQQRASRGLVAVDVVDPGLLLRRVHLDLTGLPPDSDDYSRFSHDHSAAAYERLVDRLLASLEHAERWARHWMDIWRYSDWYGLGSQVRNSQKHIWHWRDWIIQSLHHDKGYDSSLCKSLMH